MIPVRAQSSELSDLLSKLSFLVALEPRKDSCSMRHRFAETGRDETGEMVGTETGLQ